MDGLRDGVPLKSGRQDPQILFDGFFSMGNTVLKNEIFSVKIRDVEILKERTQSKHESLQSRKIYGRTC